MEFDVQEPSTMWSEQNHQWGEVLVDRQRLSKSRSWSKTSACEFDVKSSFVLDLGSDLSSHTERRRDALRFFPLANIRLSFYLFICFYQRLLVHFRRIGEHRAATSIEFCLRWSSSQLQASERFLIFLQFAFRSVLFFLLPIFLSLEPVAPLHELVL